MEASCEYVPSPSLAATAAALVATLLTTTTRAQAATADRWGFAYVDDPTVTVLTDLDHAHQYGPWKTAFPALWAQGVKLAPGWFPWCAFPGQRPARQRPRHSGHTRTGDHQASDRSPVPQSPSGRPEIDDAARYCGKSGAGGLAHDSTSRLGGGRGQRSLTAHQSTRRRQKNVAAVGRGQLHLGEGQRRDRCRTGRPGVSARFQRAEEGSSTAVRQRPGRKSPVCRPTPDPRRCKVGRSFGTAGWTSPRRRALASLTTRQAVRRVRPFLVPPHVG